MQVMCTYAAALFAQDLDFYDDAGRPMFATPEGIAAMQTLADLVPISPPAASTWDIVAAAEAVAARVTAVPARAGSVAATEAIAAIGAMSPSML